MTQTHKQRKNHFCVGGGGWRGPAAKSQQQRRETGAAEVMTRLESSFMLSYAIILNVDDPLSICNIVAHSLRELQRRNTLCVKKALINNQLSPSSFFSSISWSSPLTHSLPLETQYIKRESADNQGLSPSSSFSVSWSSPPRLVAPYSIQNPAGPCSLRRRRLPRPCALAG